MNIGATRWATLLTAYLLSFGAKNTSRILTSYRFGSLRPIPVSKPLTGLPPDCATSFSRIAEPRPTKVCSLSCPRG